MKDYVIKATAAEGALRALAARTTDTAETARRIHGLLPVAAAALGRVMTAAAMMSADMKGRRNAVSILVKGDGPLGNIVTVASSGGRIKGYVDNPKVDLPLNALGKLDVSGGIGKDGRLTVIKDLGLKEPYVGQVALLTGEIGEDIAGYYLASEQQPSVVALGTLLDKDLSVRAAGGYVLQAMPGAHGKLLDAVEARLAQMAPISALIDAGKTPEEILLSLLGDLDVKIHGKTDTFFACDCSRERLEGVVLSLGREEIKSILQTDGQAELVCHYCNQPYHFSGEALRGLLTKAGAAGESRK